MILYFKPGACSLADHIALHAAGLDFAKVEVDLKAKTTADGDDYLAINPKGYVPALMLDDGQLLTENVAILSWIADQSGDLTPPGPLGRYRQTELLAYLGGEVHKAFKPYFTPGTTDEAKAAAGEMVVKKMAYLADRMGGDFLMGDRFTTPDAYLFIMLLWTRKLGITPPEPLPAYQARMAALPFVKLAMQHEGLA